jgi:hypothetical protein
VPRGSIEQTWASQGGLPDTLLTFQQYRPISKFVFQLLVLRFFRIVTMPSRSFWPSFRASLWPIYALGLIATIYLGSGLVLTGRSPASLLPSCLIGAVIIWSGSLYAATFRIEGKDKLQTLGAIALLGIMSTFALLFFLLRPETWQSGDVIVRKPLLVVTGLAIAVMVSVLTRSPVRVKLNANLLKAAILTAAAFLCLGLTYVALSRLVLPWDEAFSWQRARLLAGAFRNGGFAAGFTSILNSFTFDYSLLPYIPASLVFVAFGGDHQRLVYEAVLLVTCVMPAALGLSFLIRILAGESWRQARPLIIVATGLLAFMIYPVGLRVALIGMPDVVGLALIIPMIVLSDRLLGLIGRGERAATPERRRVICGAIAFALVLGLCAFYLRRWYAFALLGLGAATAIELALIHVVGQRLNRVLVRSVIATILFVGLLGVLPVLTAWSIEPQRAAYASVYASFWHGWADTPRRAVIWYGLIPLLAVPCGWIWLQCVTPRPRLLRIVVVSNCVAMLAFHRIQTPDIHHFYLMAPMFCGIIGASLITLWRRSVRWGALAAAVTILAIVPAGLGIRPWPAGPEFTFAPERRNDIAELIRLSRWFETVPTTKQRACVLASSTLMNSSIITGLWQLQPDDRPGREARLVFHGYDLGDVDSTVTGPSPDLKLCRYALVADPIQLHRGPERQQIVVIPAEDILSGRGLGAAFMELPERFHLDSGVTVRVFERQRPTTEAEFEDLKRRYFEARARFSGS